jgi:hypothetical protein
MTDNVGSAFPDECMDHPNNPDRALLAKTVRPNSVLRRATAVPKFTVTADQGLADNFEIDTNQAACECTCGEFNPVSMAAFDCIGNFAIVDDVSGVPNDNDFFVFGLAGSGGSNFLTSKDPARICPSKVKFDFYFANAMAANSLDRTLTIEVIDAADPAIVLFSVPVPSATLAGFPAGQTTKFQTVLGEEVTLFDTNTYNECVDNAKLRFTWLIPEADTGSGVFVLDQVSVTPLLKGPGGGGSNGDPHVSTWRGQHFDYHGECDLVLFQSPTFESGLGLAVHIRTQIRHGMSFISSAALRIGTDVLEVASQGVYYLNGVAGADLPAAFAGFAFSHTQPTDKQHVFDVHLGGREHIKIKTYKDFVSVLVEKGSSKHFGDSVGLMGDFDMGHLFSRDGETVFDDLNAYGQEWQVLSTEPTLFQTARFPQHPQMCTLPPPATESRGLRRRLSESSVEELAAEKACAHLGERKDDCVFDVLATGDLDMATAGSY